MKTKLLLTYTLLLSVFCIYANTDKYRLILVDDPSTTITIGWNQISGTSPTVHYDSVDHNTNHTQYAFSKTQDRAIIHKGMDNRFVRLTGLTPNTNYYFVINDSQGTSQRFWFRTAPSDNSRLSFIAGGDSRNNRTPRQNANLLVSKLKPHAVFFGGDMTDDNTNTQWQNWFDDWQLTTAADGRMFPIVPARGNHETNASTVYNLFDTPNTNSYYAMTFGDDLIRTYTLNSEISILGNQLTWLQNDLAASGNLTWKMAQYHKPMRPHAAWKAENNTQYDAWAQLFYDENVRLVVDCDSHMAKTTWPVKPSSEPGNDEGFVVEQTNGTVYTGEGCWGAPLRSNDDDKSWTRSSGSFNQFKLIFVEPSKIELRTIDVNNATSVGSVSNTDPFTLPSLLNVFTPSTGAVVTISNTTDSSCPAEGSPCDDGNPNTAYDEEDGSCNCVGLPENDLVVTDIPVSASSDDAEELISTGVVSLSSSDLELIDDIDSGEQVVGIRFNNVQFPDAGTLERVYIQFQTDETNSAADPTNIDIHGELAIASQTFSTATNNITSRNLTVNSIPWYNVKKWGKTGNSNFNQRTPDLSLITQEVIDQSGWVSGNSLTFIFSGTGRRVAEAFNGTQPPILRLIYSYNCPFDSIELGATNACDSQTDTYSQDIILHYSDAPTTGTINVNGQTFAIGSSPQTITLTGLNANGFDVDVSAYFSEEPSCIFEEEEFFEAPSNCSNDGIPDNIPDDNLNLALVTDATVTGSVVGGRGTVDNILYDPSINAYYDISNWNEYGLNFNENIGKPSIDEGIKYQVNWQNVKYINYITFGGSYPNQPQPNTMWSISYRKDGIWTTLAQGQGGWIDDGIFEWGGASFNPIEADALRLQLYSDGINDLISTHLRGRGGFSNSTNDSNTTPKASLIQYLAPGNNCGVSLPTGSILYCSGEWIYSDGPDDTSSNKNTIVANGTYIIDEDKVVEINDLEISSGATVIVKEGASLTIKGDLINNGNLELESISSKYSSLIVEGTSTGNVLYRRHVNSAAGTGASTTANDLISPPVSGQNFGNFRATNPNILSGTIGGSPAFLFGPFNPSTVSYINYSSSDDSSILTSGIGYRSGSTNNSTYSFNGSVETSAVNAPIVAGGSSNWNLIGNPYPSYLNVQDFLNHLTNSGLIDENAVGIYGYDGSATDGWTIYNLATTTASTLITPGQGFFVDAQSSGNITFTPNMRSKGSGDDFILGRSNNVLTYLKLKGETSNKSYHTDFYFNVNASLGLDPGYDAAIWNNTPPSFSIYSNLVDNNAGIAMALQAFNTTDLTSLIIPIGVNTNANESFTFSILETTLSSDLNIYLEDRLNNTNTLLNDRNYTFTPTEAISGTGRFYLHIASQTLSTIDESLSTLKIYTDQNEHSIIVDGLLKEDTKFNLYSIGGQLVDQKSLDSTETRQSIDVSNLSQGIYIVEILSNSNEKHIKKLIIN